MRATDTSGNGHTAYDEPERYENTDVSDDFDWSEPSGGAVNLFEDDDGPCHDDTDVEDGPYCPIDALDALELCGRLAYEIANGETVTPEDAARAASRAVKCLASYDYEQQPWFTEAWPFTSGPAPNDTRTDDKSKESPVDAGSRDKCERAATT